MKNLSLIVMLVGLPTVASAFCELSESQDVDVMLLGALLLKTFNTFVLFAGPVLVLFTVFRIVQHWRHPVKYKRPTVFISLLAVLFAVYVVLRVFEFLIPQCFVGV